MQGSQKGEKFLLCDSIGFCLLSVTLVISRHCQWGSFLGSVYISVSQMSHYPICTSLSFLSFVVQYLCTFWSNAILECELGGRIQHQRNFLCSYSQTTLSSFNRKGIMHKWRPRLHWGGGRLKTEIERCRIAIHLLIPMHRFINAPIHRTDSNASLITDASGFNRCIGTELMNRFKLITDYYRCIGKNYQCIGNLAMHQI